MRESPFESLRSIQVGAAPLFVGTIVAVLLSIVGVLFFDLSLAAIDRRESAAHAANAYNDGLQLLRAKEPAAALERFRTAAGIDRANTNYTLALSEAMLEAGRVADAESTLTALLANAENDGAVNLTMAHVMAREARFNEAKAYFHRAIFGRWGADSTTRRTQARFELIDLLSRHGAPTELLAELLPFEEVPAESTAFRLRLGRLFLRAGSPARAATMFRGVLQLEPENADGFAGMGEAALASGNFRTARLDLERAARLKPDDERLRARLVLADTVLGLDPAASGLAPGDRYDRSRRLLARTLDALALCGDANSAAADSARALLGREPARHGVPASDTVVAAAIDLWSARSARCNAALNDEALRLVQSHLVP